MPVIRTCAQCQQKNRVGAGHLADTGKCGACKAALPPVRQTSRVVDTNPVVAESKWDGVEEDPVVVPSRVVSGRTSADTSSELRRAETEFVQGQPVHVIYRPSRGLEVADG